MKKSFKLSAFVSTAFLLPVVAFAQFTADGGTFGTLLGNIITFINGILIPFIIGIGFLFFVWGMFLYFIAGGANDESKEKGRSLMVYATLGFVLIIIFWGVVNLIAGSTGFDDQSIATVPGAAPITPGAAGGG